MKSIKTYLIILIALVLVGCTKGFEELNTPPTTSSTIDPGVLLTAAQRDSKFTQGHEYQSLTAGAWIQQWVSSNNLPSSRYYFQRHRGEDWSTLYNCLKNLGQIRHHLLKGEEDTPDGRTRLAIARIVEVDLWQTLTDLYGDVPYSESALGESDLNTHPKYDRQEDIYTSLLSTLDEAKGNLNASDKSYGSNDLYYGGNVNQWVKYANAVKLQIGMRMKYANPSLARTTVEQALNGPIIASNADNAKINTSTQYDSSRHPVLNLFRRGSPDNKYLGKAFVDHLLATNDPRLRMIAAPTINSVAAGTPEYKGKLAAPTDDELLGIVNNDYSMASDLTYFNDSYNTSNPIPCYIYTYAEICFYKAEAALEGWGGMNADQAEALYQEGIRAAMELEPYKITEIPQDYIDAQFSFAGLSPEQKLEKIMNQKWILMFGRSYDIYAEWRRTGYPTLQPGHNLGDSNGTIPRRRGYPQEELDLNPDNHREAASRMSHGDSYLSRVWWDCK